MIFTEMFKGAFQSVFIGDYDKDKMEETMNEHVKKRRKYKYIKFITNITYIKMI